MATLSESRPMFSRVVEQRPSSSWRSAAPAVLILIAAVVLVAYLASKVSSHSQRATVAERDAATARQQVEGMQKRTADLEREMAHLRDPGRTMVVLQGKGPGWAAVTWGEEGDGKTWVRTNAYGFQAPPQGKEYGVWLEPLNGAPIDAGKLDPSQDGSAFATGKQLPGVDSGKRILISLEPDNAKAPDQVLVQANLPKLKPSATAPAAAPADQGATTPGGATAGSADAPVQGGTDPAAGQRAGGTHGPAGATKGK